MNTRNTTALLKQYLLSNPVASLDARYGPYSSKQEAVDTLGDNDLAVLKVGSSNGLTVGIIENGKVVEYWFQGGIDVEHLVPKQVVNYCIIDVIPAYLDTSAGATPSTIKIIRPISGGKLGPYDPASPDWYSSEVVNAKDGAIYMTPAIIGGVPDWSDGKVSFYQKISSGWAELTTLDNGKLYYCVDDGKMYRWNGSALVDTAINTTDDLPEGNNNKYFTEQRAKEAIVGRLNTEDRIAALNSIIDAGGGSGEYIPLSRLVVNWNSTPSDDNVPSEKLVYQSAVWQK